MWSYLLAKVKDTDEKYILLGSYVSLASFQYKIKQNGQDQSTVIVSKTVSMKAWLQSNPKINKIYQPPNELFHLLNFFLFASKTKSVVSSTFSILACNSTLLLFNLFAMVTSDTKLSLSVSLISSFFFYWSRKLFVHCFTSLLKIINFLSLISSFIMHCCFFLTATWLTHSQLWATIEEAVSLSWC